MKAYRYGLYEPSMLPMKRPMAANECLDRQPTSAKISRRSTAKGLVVGAGFSFLSSVIGAKTAAAIFDGPVAITGAGKVRGFIDKEIHVFKGIFYGADTAPRRFMAQIPPNLEREYARLRSLARVRRSSGRRPTCPLRGQSLIQEAAKTFRPCSDLSIGPNAQTTLPHRVTLVCSGKRQDAKDFVSAPFQP
jgi:hypothetical protein